MFVPVPAYKGRALFIVKTFKGIDKPFVYRKSRTLKPPKNLPKKKEGRPPATRNNSLCVEVLSKHNDLRSATLEFPFLDDIITGVARLDYNGERGLVPTTLFILLATIHEISSRSVQEAMWGSVRHARNYASALRICADAFEQAYRMRLTGANLLTVAEEFADAA